MRLVRERLDVACTEDEAKPCTLPTTLTSAACNDIEHSVTMQLQDVPMQSAMEDVAVDSEMHQVPEEFGQQTSMERTVRSTSDKCVGESLSGDAVRGTADKCVGESLWGDAVRGTSDKCVGESLWGDALLAYGIFDMP